MKAIVYNRFGNTEVLQTIEVPQPTIGANEVLVKVKAVSINPLDWKIRKGEMKLMSGSKFPRYTGVDFAGIVEATGASVTGLQKGDEVLGVVKNTMKDGSLAEYVVTPAASVWEKPSHISYTQAASIPVVGAAAVTAIEKMGKLSPQTRILINGATGGFGMFLLQLLKQTGATITAVASSRTANFARKWGADAVVDYTRQNVLHQKNTYDIIVDLSGKMTYAHAKKIMKPQSLFLNPVPKPIEILTSLISNVFTGKKHVVILSNPSSHNMQVLLNAIHAGLEIEVSKVFPFTQAREAYEYAEQGGYIGKVAIAVS